MKTLSLVTNNLAEVVSRSKISNHKQRKREGVIDAKVGLPYVNVYTLLYSINIHLKNAELVELKMLAECLVFLNPNADLLVNKIVDFIQKHANKDYDLQDIEAVVMEAITNKDITLVQPNDMVRYVCKSKMSTANIVIAIIKHRIRYSAEEASPRTRITAYFHALIDTQKTNWLEISQKDFLRVFSENDVTKYFEQIFNSIYWKRQKNLQNFLKREQTSLG